MNFKFFCIIFLQFSTNFGVRFRLQPIPQITQDNHPDLRYAIVTYDSGGLCPQNPRLMLTKLVLYEELQEVYAHKTLRGMHMLRKASVLCTIALSLILTACSSNNSSGNASGSPGGDNARNSLTAEEEITITATNYSFDQTEYHLKKGVPVKIIFKNESGNHGILVPGMKLRLDARDSSRVILPGEAGTFEMTCAIMCGSGHGQMSAKIIVE
jgi:cytochrome c oxidase subunit 2